MTRIDRVPIKNFSRASGTLFRGGIPDEDGMRFLDSLGIKTILDVRKSGRATEDECSLASDVGLNYFNVPFGYYRVPDHVIAALLALSLHPRYQPVYLHCNGGARSVALIGIYRIAVEGWPFAWAYSEMLSHDFRRWQIFLKGGVNRFAERMNSLDGQERICALQELVEANIFCS